MRIRASRGVFRRVCDPVFHHHREANAAGALATGRCGAFGYAIDDVSPEAASAARARAVQGTRLQGGHQLPPHLRGLRDRQRAMSADRTPGRSADNLARAQNIASEQCHRHGGRACVIRAWACDPKGG